MHGIVLFVVACPRLSLLNLPTVQAELSLDDGLLFLLRKLERFRVCEYTYNLLLCFAMLVVLVRTTGH